MGASILLLLLADAVSTLLRDGSGEFSVDVFDRVMDDWAGALALPKSGLLCVRPVLSSGFWLA